MMMDRSPGLRGMLGNERGLAELTRVLSNGGEGLAELAQSFGRVDAHADGRAKSAEDYIADLAILEKAKNELRTYSERQGNRGVDGAASTAAAPSADDDEQYLFDIGRGGMDEETPSVVDVYLRAHATNMDTAVPFVIAIVASTLAAIGLNLFYFLVSFATITTLVLVAYRHARLQATYMYGKRNVGTPSAMTVHAILLACGLQFFFMYVPLFFGDAPMTCFITATAFVVTPWLFYKTYAIGPGFVPTAASDFASWAATMERVSATQGGASVAENASRMMINNRYCKTCHCARPLRSKHCPFCNRCVEKMDHHCPITMTCIGARNQRCFFVAALAMFIGQCGFLRTSHMYYRMLVGIEGPRVGGTGFMPTVVTHFYVVFNHPFGMILYAMQIALTLYCFVIVARMSIGICVNLTVNEMENAVRYEYLQSGDANRPYRNVFDAGPRFNCIQFWRDYDKKRDWDGFYVAAKEKKADLPVAPKFSYSWFHSTAPRFWRWIFRIHSDTARSHGHVESDAHGQAHGKSRGVCSRRERDNLHMPRHPTHPGDSAV
jgi:palmitoyltransferase